jgi:protein SCO1/2/putative membrane protein
VSVELFPPLNATLNGLSAILLVTAYLLIRRGHWRAHAYMMVSALLTSSAFLVCYLIYHTIVGEKSTKQMGLPPWLHFTYVWIILFPHLLLAVAMLPMIFITLRRAYRRQWDLHRKIARPTFWIWLYVSVTGVVIYWMLYHLFPTITGHA